MQILLPIILVFVIVNFAVFWGGLEGWLGWNFGTFMTILIVALKLILFLGLVKIVLTIFQLEMQPLLIAGIVLAVLVIFSNIYFQQYENVFHQKRTIGKALEIKASELHLQENLSQTPYLKITNTGIGEIKKFKKCITSKCNEAVGVYADFCYANILNSVEPVFVIEECKNGLLEKLSVKTEFFAEILLKKSYYSQLDGLQLKPIEMSFDEYYNNKYQYFLNFIKIVNGIVLGFVLIFLYFELK